MSLTDQTREELRALTARYPVARSALLPMLHLVQSYEGHVSEDGIALCAEVLGLTKAEVGAVATFYTMFKREPVGDYLLSVCTNPTCKIAGAQAIYESYVEACGGKHVDPEGAGVMVEHAECLGICDAAPVVQVNYEMYGPVTHDQAMDLLAKAKAGDPPPSNWSNEVPGTFAAVERDLSGIDDGVDEWVVEAARLQATMDVPPAYRTGETDLPVTHPGGDPHGHGGQAFAAEAQLDRGPQTAPDAAAPDAAAPDAAPDAAAVDAAVDASAATPSPADVATPAEREEATAVRGEEAYTEADELAEHVEDRVPDDTPADASVTAPDAGGATPPEAAPDDTGPDQTADPRPAVTDPEEDR